MKKCEICGQKHHERDLQRIFTPTSFYYEKVCEACIYQLQEAIDLEITEIKIKNRGKKC